MPRPEMDHPQPLAYFLTFTAYGDRLHGDERGTVERWHNTPGQTRIQPAPAREAFEQERTSHPPVVFDARLRHALVDSIRETCAAREWLLGALHVRTNHVHLVVSARDPPERVMTSLKAWCTRRLRERLIISPDARLWARHGSTRYLWSSGDVEMACAYVTDGQGESLLDAGGLLCRCASIAPNREAGCLAREDACLRARLGWRTARMMLRKRLLAGN